MNEMLFEEHVISAACDYLRHHRWSIESTCSPIERGVDIIATHSDRQIEARIEAKGETSSKVGSANYGNPFSPNQIRDHVANAFYRAAIYVSEGFLAGIALPDEPQHQHRVRRIENVLAILGIEVFWVSRNRDVRVVGNWQNPPISTDSLLVHQLLELGIE